MTMQYQTNQQPTKPNPSNENKITTGRDEKALDLLGRMLQFNPAARPSAEEVRLPCSSVPCVRLCT